MNELEKALRRLAQAQHNARRAGEILTETDYDEFLRIETGGKYGWEDAKDVLGQPGMRNIARGIAQGALLNWGDEALGLVDPVGAEEMRIRERMFNQESPKSALGANVAGGIVGGLAVPGSAAARGAGIGTAVLKGMGVGAVAGGVAGAGAAEGGVMERIDAAGPAAGIGMVAGGLIPSIVGGGVAAASPRLRAQRLVRGAIAEDGGVGAVRSRLGSYGAAGRGDEVMMGDLGPNLRYLADQAANTDPAARVAIQRAATNRQANMAGRIFDDLEEIRGGNPDAELTKGQLQSDLRDWAAGPGGYEGLRQAYPDMSSAVDLRFSTIVRQPKVVDAWNRAKEAGLVGQMPDLGRPSFQMLQDVKESLDDAITQAYRQGRGNLGTRLRDARQVIIDQLDAIPEYRAVANEYRSRVAVIDALDDGVAAWHADDLQVLTRRFNAMSPAEQETFRLGMASEMRKELQRAGTNVDAARKYATRSKVLARKLEIVFGNQQDFERFVSRADLEEEMMRMTGTYGNSMSELRKVMRESDPIEQGASLVTTGLGATLANAVTGGAVRNIQRRTGAELGRIVGTQGFRNIDQMLNGPIQAPMVHPFLTNISPFAMGSLIGGQTRR